MLANPAIMVVAPLVFKDNGYDADKDFQPVAHVTDMNSAWRSPRLRAGQAAVAPARLAARQPDAGQLRRAGHRQPAALLRADDGREGAGRRRR